MFTKEAAGHAFDRLSRIEGFLSRYEDVMLSRLLPGVDEVLSYRFDHETISLVVMDESGTQYTRKFPFAGLSVFFSRVVGVDIGSFGLALSPLAEMASFALGVNLKDRYGNQKYSIEKVSFNSGGCEFLVYLYPSTRIIDFVKKNDFLGFLDGAGSVLVR